MARRKPPVIPDDLLDQLLAGRDPQTVLGRDCLVDELKRALAERALNAELACWNCCDRLCSSCHKPTGSAFLAVFAGLGGARPSTRCASSHPSSASRAAAIACARERPYVTQPGASAKIAFQERPSFSKRTWYCIGASRRALAQRFARCF